MLDNYRDNEPFTILIVDDDVVIRNMLQRLLEEQGYRIIEAENGRAGLGAFQRYLPDLVLMDAAMPVMDGFAACGEIRRLPQGKDTPIVMITSLYDDSSVDQAFAAGAMEYITKPIHWAALRHRVNVLLSARQAELALARSEARFRGIFEQAAMGIALVDGTGLLLESNPALQTILGLSYAELRGVYFNKLLYPADSLIEREFQEQLQNGGRAYYQMEKFFYLQADKNDKRWVNLTASLVFDADAKPQYTIYMLEDITAHKQSQRKQLIAQKVFENTQDGIIVTDAAGVIVDVNHAFSLVTGYNYEEVLDKNPNILQSGKHGPEFYQAMWNSLHQTGRWSGEVWNRRSNGEVYSQWLSISALRGDGNEVTNYVGVFSDLTLLQDGDDALKRLAHYDERMYYLTNYDALTDLPNRLLFHEQLMRACRASQKVALLCLDLEDFNFINENFGHDHGDRVLRETAKRLKACLRDSDTVARLEGDEFGLILTPLGQAHEARILAQRVFEALSRPFIVDGRELHLNSHLGISFYPDPQHRYEEIPANVELMIQHADLAMYQAKEQDKNTYKIFEDS